MLDYSKYKYEQAQKHKQARKHQQQITIREIKFRPKIAQHDYDTKKHHVERFLRHKDKVKVTIMFRGREVTHPERGTAILDRLAEELSELGVVEQRPMQEGRNMTMMMAPVQGRARGHAPSAATAADEVRTAPPTSATSPPRRSSRAPAATARRATPSRQTSRACAPRGDARRAAADGRAPRPRTTAEAGRRRSRRLRASSRRR